MTCQAYHQQLGDYVDGTLDPGETGVITAHLDSCASCRALVADFSTLRVATRRLDRAIPPPHLWSNISAAVELEKRRTFIQRWQAWAAPPRFSAALAAAVVIVLLCGGSWIAWREVITVRSSQPATSAANSKALDTFETELTLAEEHYTKAIASLEQITKTDASALDGPTAQVLQANMAVIDTAIGQSRDALKAEPASEVAQESLFDALRSKVALLQNTVALINEMRKGNQAGAARIVSGMNQ
jgi:hypothetical protein